MDDPNSPRELAQLDKQYAKLAKAEQELAAFRKKYRDVLAITEYWTIYDVAEFPLQANTPAGPNKQTPFKELYPVKKAAEVIKLLAENEQDPDWTRFMFAIKETLKGTRP